MTSTQITLSIETAPGHCVQHGFHLGTDERLARQIAEEKFNARRNHNIPVVTVAILRAGRMIDWYDGKWGSQY